MEKHPMEWFSYLQPRTKIHEIIFHSFFLVFQTGGTQNASDTKCMATMDEALHCRQSIKHLTHNVAQYANTDTAGKHIYYRWLSQTSNGKSVCCCFEARSYTVAQGGLGLIV